MISNPLNCEADRLCCCTCDLYCFSLIVAIPAEEELKGLRQDGQIPAAGHGWSGAPAAETFSAGLPGVVDVCSYKPVPVNVGPYVIGPLPEIYYLRTPWLAHTPHQHATNTGE